MSKKPVNFYQGAKGTFEIEIIPNETIVDGESVITFKATHTFAEIKQAIADGFLPYCVIKGNQAIYHILYNYNDSDDSGHVMFTSEAGVISIRYNNTVKVEEKESGGSDDSGGIMYINSLPPSDENKTLTPDKTFAEVREALSNGILPVYRYVLLPPIGEGIVATFYLSSASPDSIIFTNTNATENMTTGDITLTSLAVTMTRSGTTASGVTYTLHSNV